MCSERLAPGCASMVKQFTPRVRGESTERAPPRWPAALSTTRTPVPTRRKISASRLRATRCMPSNWLGHPPAKPSFVRSLPRWEASAYLLSLCWVQIPACRFASKPTACISNFPPRTPASSPTRFASALKRGETNSGPSHLIVERDQGDFVANRLEGKIAAVTGGDQGIGRAIVERLAAEGADVALCFRSNQAGADEVVAAVQKNGRKAAAFQCDVGKVADGQRFISDAVKQR